MGESKVIRLNKVCNTYIDEIRNIWVNGFNNSKLQPNKEFFSDVSIISLALSHYFHYLKDDEEDV